MLTPQPTTQAERPASLLRIPQIVALVVAVASVIILVVAVVAPDLLSNDPSRRPELDIAGLQATAEVRERVPTPTSERSLSDLIATAGPTPSPAVAEPAAPTGTPAPPPEPIEIGAALEDFPGDFAAISRFGELSGRMPDIVMFFQAWGSNDRDFKDWLPQLADMGVTPLITWEPWERDAFLNQEVYTSEAILAGEHDAYIDTWALRAAEYGGPIFLRFAHEMNTPPGKTYWYPWQGDPAEYIAVWRYVHDRFEAAGASNVEWVWSVAWMNRDAQAYYPGDAYVDWVGLTVLNFGEGKAGWRWRSFDELYSIQQRQVLSYNKPVMITELACAEQGGDKGQWIAEIGDDIAQRFPEIRALVWLNYSRSREFEAINWRVDSTPGALAGWRGLLAHQIVTGR